MRIVWSRSHWMIFLTQLFLLCGGTLYGYLQPHWSATQKVICISALLIHFVVTLVILVKASASYGEKLHQK